MKKKLLWFIPIVLLVIIYQFIFNSSYQASQYALSLADQADKQDNYLKFTPDTASQTGFILYPGGRVAYEAYSPLMDQLKNKGYTAFIVNMPLDLAILGSDRAKSIIDDHSEITTWYMMGHSLGGVMAAQYTYENLESIEGLILLASYPQDKHDFSSEDIKILSIVGDKDGLVDQVTFDNAKALLPNHATTKIIEGANHAQMGSYGLQKKDMAATISSEKQIELIIDLIIHWMN